MNFLLKLLLNFKNKKPKTKPINDLLAQLTIGDNVSLKFKEPRLMGFVNEVQSYSRFDPSDYPHRIIEGEITLVYEDKVIPNFYMIFVYSKKASGFKKEYMLFGSDIEEIKILNKKDQK